MTEEKLNTTKTGIKNSMVDARVEQWIKDEKIPDIESIELHIRMWEQEPKSELKDRTLTGLKEELHYRTTN